MLTMYTKASRNPFRTAEAFYSLRKIFKNSIYPIKVRRSSSNDLLNVPYSNSVIDTQELIDFTVYNDIGSFVNPTMDVDTNGDGVVDGFNKDGLGTASLVNGCQRISIPANFSGAVAVYQWVNNTISGGDDISVTFSAKKILGGKNMWCQLVMWQDGSYKGQESLYVSSSSLNDYTITYNNVPAGTNQFYIKFTLSDYSGTNSEAAFDICEIKSVNITTSAYVDTWYDQGNYGHHLSNSNATNQPRIVNKGVVEVDANNNPTIQFLGNEFLENIVVLNSRFVNLVVNKELNDENHSLVSTGSLDGINIHFTTANYFYVLKYGVGTKYKIDETITDTNYRIYTAENLSDPPKAYENGTEKPLVAPAASTVYSDKLSIGARTVSGTDDLFFTGNISEICLFNQPLNTADRDKIHQSQSAYYGITLS